MKDNTGPVHVDVGMRILYHEKKPILDVRDDFISINTKDFKDSI